MHIDWCPHGPQWEELKAKIGPTEGMRACMAENRIPDASEFPKGGKYSDIVLQPTKLVDYSHIPDDKFDDRYRAIADRKAELESQGAQIIGLGANGFRYTIPEGNNKYYQLTDKNQVKYDIQATIAGTLRQAGSDTIYSALQYYRPSKGPSTENRKRGFWEGQSISEYLKENNLIYKDKIDKKTRIGGGGEQEVYYQPVTDTVVKVNTTTAYNDTKQYLQNLLIHNYLFPKTAYKLLGFIEIADNPKFPHAVVEQAYVRSEESFDDSIVNKTLNDIGFVSYIAKGTEQYLPYNYYNSDLGIYMLDMHTKNVLIKDGQPFFIDTQFKINPQEFYKKEENQQKGSMGEKPIPELDKKIEGFLDSVGANVEHIADRGQSWNAVADTLSGIIQVVDGKADMHTLGHEATHMFLDLLDDDSKLLKDIIRDVVNRNEYDKVYEQYKDDPQYQVNGKVDEVKMAKEAAAHIIDKIIVGRYKDKKAMKWWERLWNHIKALFSDKSLDNYEQVAEDILENDITQLSPEKIKAIQEANSRGELYYQLSPRDEAYVKGISKLATAMQKKVIDDVYLNPKVTLDEKTHIYSEIKNPDIKYTSVTTLINGKTHLEPEDYALNKAWGNDFDSIMQGIALGKSLGEIEDITELDPEQQQKAYDILADYYNQIAGPGDVILTQVIVHDLITKVAGSIDILVVHPDGTTDIIDLKTIGKNKSYTTTYTPGEGAVIQEAMSRKMKHAIQVATYRRLLGVMGYPNSKVSAMYVKLDIEGDKKDQILRDFEKGDQIPFTETSWDTYARKIVPTEPIVDKSEPESIYTEEEVTPDNPDTIMGTDIPKEKVDEKLDDTLNSIQDIFESRIRYFEALEKGGSSLVPDSSTVKSIQNLIYHIGQDRKVAKREAAYGRFLTYAQDEVNRWIKYIAATKNYSDTNYFNVVDEVMKFLKSYENLEWVRQGTNAGQQKDVQNLEDSLENLGKTISVGAFGYIKKKVEENYPGMSAEDIDKLLREQQDITKEALIAHDLAGSRDKLAAALDITVKRALDIIARAQEQREEELRHKATEFEKINGKITKDSFNFMYDKDKMLQKIGDDYQKLKTEINSIQIGEDGEYMRPKLITSLEGADPEKIAYNKKLGAIKDRVRKFNEAEQIIDGEAVGGEYHEYTPEYIAARAKVMTLVKRGPIVVWERRRGVSDDEFNTFRKNYMEYNPYWKLQKKKNPLTRSYEYTGLVTRIEDDRAWFPSKDNVIVREISHSGKDMVNPRYKKLMNPSTQLEHAQKGLYETYMRIMGDYADKIGPDAQKWLKSGDRVALMGSWVQQAQEKGMLQASKNYVKNQFTPTVFARTAVTDEGGTVRQSIPRLYMGGLQNQKTIDNLTNKVTQLGEQKGSGKMTLKVYNEQMKELTYQLKIEQAKPTSSDLEYDVFKQLIAYSNMAENFIHLSAIEGTVKAFDRAISGDIKVVTLGENGKVDYGEGRKYYDKNAKEQVITIPGTDQPAVKADPNIVKRVRSYISQVFYEDKNLTKTQAEVMVKRIMNYTSLVSVGLNLFGNINNYVIGKINHVVNGFSGKYYERKAMWRAQKAMTGTIIPGIATKVVQHIEGSYNKKRAATKEEALLDKYRVIREQKSGEEQSSFFSWLKFPYKGAQAGEYIVQGIPGLAVLMSTDSKVHNQIRPMSRTLSDGTVETCSIADAHEFIDGELTLKKGFTESPEELFRTTNYIFEVNKDIHGSYAPEDILYMQRDLLGKMVIQFHKHILPAVKNRFAKGYDHATLGEFEGRYRTILAYVKGLKDVSGNWYERVTKSWHELSDVQKKNMLQNAAELVSIIGAYVAYVVLSGIAKGLDPDENPYLKRFANFLSYQSSRAYSEQVSMTPTPMGAVQMYQFVKNPMAINSMAKNMGELMLSTTQLPFQADYSTWTLDPDAVYQKGPYKGQIKAVHQLKKISPLISNLERWSSMDQIGHFSLIGQ